MQLKFVGALASLAVTAGNLSAATMSVSSTAPTVNGADIAQLNVTGHLDPGGDEGHVWSNRPLQGQTFTTGSNPAGYLLNSVTMVNEENTVSNNTATFEVRIGTVLGTVFAQVGTETSNNAFSYVPNDYITFNYTVPVALLPNTVYGFMWDTSGSGFTTWNNANTEYPGGEAFSSGGGGVADDNNLVFRGLDREFHLDIDAIPEPSATMLGLAGLAFLLRRRRSREGLGRVLAHARRSRAGRNSISLGGGLVIGVSRSTGS
jgi:MYXO-CTERM domain-containing protein